MTITYLPAAVRAYTEAVSAEPGGQSPGDAPTRKVARWPSAVLVIDTETTTDPTQRLTFGNYWYCRWDAKDALVCVEEGLIYADDLPGRDPDGFAILRGYAAAHRAAVADGCNPTLHLRSRREFNARVLFRAAYKVRALVVGFNLPFDLARLASSWGAAEGSFAGGFSLVLWDYRDGRGGWQPDRHRPRVCIKQLTASAP